MSPLVFYCATSASVNALTSLVLGLYVIATNRRSLASRTFFGFAMSVAFWGFCYTLWQLSTQTNQALFWTRALMAGAIFIPTCFIHFVVTFLGLDSWKRRLVRFSYLFSTVLLLSDFTPLFISGITQRPPFPFWPVPGPFFHPFLFHFAAVVIYAHYLMYRELQATTGSRRNQIRYVALGTFLGFSGGATNFPLWYNIPIPPIGNALVAVYVAMTAYAIARYRLLDINVALTRAILFAVVYVPLLLLPIIICKALEPVLTAWFSANWWLVPTVSEALFAASGLVAYRYVQKRAESRLLAKERETLDTLLRASRDMPRIRSIRRLVRVIVSVLGTRMGVSPVAVYLADVKGTHYTLMSSRGYNPSPAEAALEVGAPFIQYLRTRKEKGPVVREELLFQQRGGWVADLKEVVGHMKQLGAECVVPSFSKDHLLGFVVLGAKQSDRMYTDGDLKTLETLANQAALAVENARFYEAEKEHRAQMFHEAKLASLGKTANNMSHQINNRFHFQSVLAGTRVESLKDLDFRKLSWGELVQIIEQDRLTFDKIANDALRGGDICIRFLRHTRKTPPGWFSFADVVAESAGLCQYMNKDLFERMDYEKQIEESLPQMYGQKNDLVEVLNNMTTNAYDAIEKKEVMLQDGRFPPLPEGQTYRGKIRVRVASILKDGEPWIRVEFSDNGSGMTPEELEQLFTPFFTTKGAEKGTGVGTYIMQGMIQAHRGNMEVNSVYGEGTTFIILLPIKKPEVQQEKKDGTPESPP